MAYRLPDYQSRLNTVLLNLNDAGIKLSMYMITGQCSSGIYYYKENLSMPLKYISIHSLL